MNNEGADFEIYFISKCLTMFLLDVFIFVLICDHHV